MAETQPAERQALSEPSSSVDTRSTLTERALTGFLWSSGAFVVQKGLILVSTLVLARLLTPADFGVVAFALSVMAYLGRLSDLGINAALIQRRDAHDPRIASTVFWMSLMGGVVVFVISFVAAPYVADVSGDPQTQSIMRVLSITFLIGALGSAHGALFDSSLAFRQAAASGLVGGLGKSVVSIATAVAGAGVWSLVAGQVAGAAAGVATTWRISAWRPRFVFARDQVRSLLSFGLGVTALGLVAELVMNLDYLLIGSQLGAAALGIYFLAFRLPELVLASLSQVAWRVLFPLYARWTDAIEDEQEKASQLAHGYVATIRLGGLALLPAGFGMAALASPLILVLFGDKWREATDVMAVIAIFAALAGLAGMPGTVLKSLGRTWLMTANALVHLAILAPALVIAVRFGIVAVAVSHLVVEVCFLIFASYMLQRVVHVAWWRTPKELGPGLVVGALTGAAVYPLALTLPSVAALGLGIPVGVLVFVGALRLLYPADAARLWTLAQRIRRPGTRGSPA